MKGQQIRCNSGADGIVRMEESKQSALGPPWPARVNACSPKGSFRVFPKGYAKNAAINGLTLERQVEMSFSSIEEAVAAIESGKMIIVVDDHSRENEGDIIVAADSTTSEHIAFMMNKARGLVCIAMEGERIDQLELPLMVPNNTELYKTAFTVSVDYLPGTTTGISAADRAATVRALVDPTSKPEEFARPGHMFPLRAKQGGVRARPGHTEAAVELCKLAGRFPAGVICEVAKDDGTMARLPDLQIFAKEHGLPLIAIEDLITYLNDRDAAKARTSVAA